MGHQPFYDSSPGAKVHRICKTAKLLMDFLFILLLFHDFVSSRTEYAQVYDRVFGTWGGDSHFKFQSGRI
jgi:hypothetical protein